MSCIVVFILGGEGHLRGLRGQLSGNILNGKKWTFEQNGNSHFERITCIPVDVSQVKVFSIQVHVAPLSIDIRSLYMWPKNQSIFRFIDLEKVCTL